MTFLTNKNTQWTMDDKLLRPSLFSSTPSINVNVRTFEELTVQPIVFNLYLYHFVFCSFRNRNPSVYESILSVEEQN